MFVQERQEQILSMLRQKGKVLVRELSERFQVTEDCIRKDLAVLEKNWPIKRVYGGAVLLRVNTHQVHVAQRKEQNLAIKQAIAEKALKVVQDGDFLFLDISTTNIAVAKLLVASGRKISVATNMIEVMQILSSWKDINLTFVGGLLNRSRDGFVGGLTNSVIAQLRFDVAFLGAAGIDVYDDAVFTYMQEDGFTKKAILHSTRQPYILAEAEKLGRIGNFRYAGLEEFRGVIMEEAPPRELYEKFAEYQLEIL